MFNEIIKIECLVCKKTVEAELVGDYAHCLECGCANYIDDKNA